MCGVGFFPQHAIYSKEDIAGIYQILHKREADLVTVQQDIVDFAVTLIYLLLGHILFCPMHRDGWHHGGGITLIAPCGIAVLRPPDVDTLEIGDCPTSVEIEVVDTKQFEIVLRPIKVGATLQDIIAHELL